MKNHLWEKNINFLLKKYSKLGLKFNLNHYHTQVMLIPLVKEPLLLIETLFLCLKMKKMEKVIEEKF
jgi:hypothetical protein